MFSPDLERARDLVLRWGWNAMAYQILNPGMRLWFSADGEGVAGYVRAGGYRIVAGAPVCPPERLAETAAEFAAETRRARQRLCYFGAQDRMIDLLTERGPVSALLLGAQPVWNPAHWRAILAGKASLRAQLARARNKGVTVRPSPTSGDPELQRCLNEWIARRGLPPMHFLVEWNILPRLLDRRLFVVRCSPGCGSTRGASTISKGWRTSSASSCRRVGSRSTPSPTGRGSRRRFSMRSPAPSAAPRLSSSLGTRSSAR